MEVLLIVICAVLIIQAVGSVKFSEIAEMKGHKGYFWWCFLLGPAGWAMVIALPDREKPVEQPAAPQPIYIQPTTVRKPASPSAAEQSDDLPDL